MFRIIVTSLLFAVLSCAFAFAQKIENPIMFDTPEADAIVEKLQVFPPDAPWNTSVEEWPVYANSDGMLKSIGLDKPLRGNRDMNYILVPLNQKKVPVAILMYPDESDQGPFPVPDATPIEGWPAYFTERHETPFTQDEMRKLFAEYQVNAEKTDADRHAVVIDPG